jgi:hypothetical protein
LVASATTGGKKRMRKHKGSKYPPAQPRHNNAIRMCRASPLLTWLLQPIDIPTLAIGIVQE